MSHCGTVFQAEASSLMRCTLAVAFLALLSGVNPSEDVWQTLRDELQCESPSCMDYSAHIGSFLERFGLSTGENATSILWNNQRFLLDLPNVGAKEGSGVVLSAYSSQDKVRHRFLSEALHCARLLLQRNPGLKIALLTNGNVIREELWMFYKVIQIPSQFLFSNIADSSPTGRQSLTRVMAYMMTPFEITLALDTTAVDCGHRTLLYVLDAMAMEPSVDVATTSRFSGVYRTSGWVLLFRWNNASFGFLKNWFLNVVLLASMPDAFDSRSCLMLNSSALTVAIQHAMQMPLSYCTRYLGDETPFHLTILQSVWSAAVQYRRISSDYFMAANVLFPGSNAIEVTPILTSNIRVLHASYGGLVKRMVINKKFYTSYCNQFQSTEQNRSHILTIRNNRISEVITTLEGYAQHEWANMDNEPVFCAEGEAVISIWSGDCSRSKLLQDPNNWCQSCDTF